jgi:hypothetical protein
MISRQLKAGLLSYSDHAAVRPRLDCENGLFLVGRDSKSIFWYWEIDSLGRTYREFRSVDSEMGMAVFKLDDWESWT